MTDVAWNHPFAGSRSSTTDKYGWRILYGEQNFHRGLDLAPGEGTQIYSIAKGTVVGHGDVGAWAGTSVVIRHDNGWHSVYAHMIAGSRSVTTGQEVSAGFPLGKVGNTGESLGAHLHLEIWAGANRANHTDPWPLVMSAPLADQITTTPTPSGDDMGLVVQISTGPGAGGIYFIARKTIVHLGSMTDVDRAVRLTGRALAVQSRAELDTFCAVLGIPGGNIVTGVKYFG